MNRLVLSFENGIVTTFGLSPKFAIDQAKVTASNQEYANGSLYRITSLEVYRGNEQVITISHDGFFLTDSGTFEVSTQMYKSSYTS